MIGYHIDETKLAAYFLVEKIEEKRAGIEHGVLRRTFVFESELGLVPTILTTNFNAHFDVIRRNIMQRKEASKHTLFLNLYDYLLGDVGLLEGDQPNRFEPGYDMKAGLGSTETVNIPSPSDSWHFREAPDSLDESLFDRRDRLRMYIKRSATGRLQYINHFNDGRKWRRDTYGSCGGLRRVQYLDDSTGFPTHENYFRQDGTLAIITRLKISGKKSTAIVIQLIGKTGKVENHFSSQRELIEHGFKSIFEASEKQLLIVCDRNQRLYQPLIDAKRKSKKGNAWFVVPFLHNTHIRFGGDPKTGKTKESYKGVLDDIGLPDAVIVSTDCQKRDIVARYGDGNIYVIPNVYVDRKESQELVLTDYDSMVVVCLGRYAIEKNQDDAIEAFTHVLREFPDAKLIFHGHGSRREELAQRIAERGLEKSIFLKGYTHNAGDVFSKAGISLLTSREEGFPQVVLQSLAHGCPVVSYDVRYGPESMIDNGYNGYIVPAGNLGQLAEKLISLMANPEQHFLMRKNAMISSNKFNLENHSRLWSGLIADFRRRDAVTGY